MGIVYSKIKYHRRRDEFRPLISTKDDSKMFVEISKCLRCQKCYKLYDVNFYFLNCVECGITLMMIDNI